MNEIHCSYKFAKILANSLLRKKWITGIKRGLYLIIPLSAGTKSQYTEHEFVIASCLISPSYIAYWSALNYHRLTEQTPLTVFVVTPKRIKNRTVLGIRYNFVTVDSRKFFGFNSVRIGAYSTNISNIEKSLVDALDHPEYCGGIIEIAKCLWNAKEKISLEKIITYSIKMNNGTIFKRLGYLLEKLNFGIDENIVEKIRRRISAGMTSLDPTIGPNGVYNTKWNLMVNVTKSKLQSWETEH